MKPGVVAAALIVVGGAAAGGALAVRELQAADAADAAFAKGNAALKTGSLGDAAQAFREAAEAAGRVAGLTGRRGDALQIAEEANLDLALIAAVEAAKRGEPAPLLRLSAATGELPAWAGDDLLAGRAIALLALARGLERGGVLARAEKAYEAAVAAAGDDAGRANEAAYGLRRVEIKGHLHAAEEAARARQVPRAAEELEQVHRAFAAEPSPFAGETADEAAPLRARIALLDAEVADHHAVEAFREAVLALDRRVPTQALGSLLPEVEALALPTVKGGHPREAWLRQRLTRAQQRQERIREVAAAFEGMVWVGASPAGPVFIDRDELANAAYARFVEAGGYAKADLWTAEGARLRKVFRDRTRKPGPRTWSNGAFPEGEERLPVRGVSALEAEAYARWAAKRLPTAAEWRAAAAPPGSAFPWGPRWVDGRANVNVTGNSGGAPQPVGSYEGGAGPTGARDMIGNVREVVRSGDGYLAVGGSYTNLPEDATVESSRPYNVRSRSLDTGFRCAKTLEGWKEWTE